VDTSGGGAAAPVGHGPAFPFRARIARPFVALPNGCLASHYRDFDRWSEAVEAAAAALVVASET